MIIETMYKKKIFPFLFFSEDIERVYLICTGFIKYSIIEVYIIKIRKNNTDMYAKPYFSI